MTAKKAGKATITATVGKKKLTCKVTVKAVKLSKTKLTLTAGKSATLKLTGAKIKSVTSSNKKVAKVTKKGKITGVKAGKATITFKDTKGKKYTCKVTVKAKPAATQPETVKVTGITLNKSTASLEEGATLQLSATAAPSNAANKAVTWSSSNANVAAVSASGLITAKAAGSATITATAQDGSNKKASCTVTVTKKVVAVTGITLNKSAASLEEGATLQLSATAAPSTATNKAVTWSSSNTSVAAVSASGLITAKAAGSATITATAQDGSSKKAACTVTVTKKVVKVTGITLNKSTASLEEGSTLQLSATAAPSTATNKAVTWSSSNAGVASISASGLITAKAAGSATITAAAQDGSSKMATCTVTVTKKVVKVTGITLNKSTASLEEGATLQLSATAAPSTATNKAVTWSSSNTSVAVVSASGLVTAKAAGSATITAAAQDGSSKKATCTVTVTKKVVKVTGITLNKSTASLEEGATLQLSATAAPSTATNKAVTWSSSNASVASVSTSGLVTAKATGSVTITATAQDGSGKKAACTVTVTQKVIKVTGITLNKSSETLGVGNTLQLTATAAPSTATNKAVTWSSSNASVATVSASGLVSAKAAGSATITATAKDGSGKQASCTVAVMAEQSDPGDLNAELQELAELQDDIRNDDLYLRISGSYKLYVNEILSQADAAVSMKTSDAAVIAELKSKLTEIYNGIMNSGRGYDVRSIEGEGIRSWRRNGGSIILYGYTENMPDTELEVSAYDGFHATVEDTDEEDYVKRIILRNDESGVEFDWYVRYLVTPFMFEPWTVTGESVLDYYCSASLYGNGTLEIVGSTENLPTLELTTRENVSWEQTTDEDGKPIMRMTYGAATYIFNIVYERADFFFELSDAGGLGILNYRVENAETSGSLYLTGLTDTIPDDWYANTKYNNINIDEKSSTTLELSGMGQTYTYEVVYNQIESTDLELDMEETAEITEEKPYQVYTFTPDETAVYEFRSYNRTDDPRAYLYMNGEELRYSDDEYSLNFSIKYALHAGKSYTYLVRDTRGASCKVILTKTEDSLGAYTDDPVLRLQFELKEKQENIRAGRYQQLVGTYKDYVDEIFAQVDSATSNAFAETDELEELQEKLEEIIDTIEGAGYIGEVTGNDISAYSVRDDGIIILYGYSASIPDTELSVSTYGGSGNKTVTVEDTDVEGFVKRIVLRNEESGVELFWNVKYAISSDKFRIQNVTGEGIVSYSRFVYGDEYGTLVIRGITEKLPTFNLQTTYEDVIWEQIADGDGNPMLRMSFGDTTFIYDIYYTQVDNIFDLVGVRDANSYILGYRTDMGETSGTLYLTGITADIPENWSVNTKYDSVRVSEKNSNTLVLTCLDQTYTYEVVYNKAEGTALELDKEAFVEITAEKQYQVFTFTPDETAVYELSPLECSEDPFAQLLKNGERITYSDESGRRNFHLSYTLEAGQEYEYVIKDQIGGSSIIILTKLEEEEADASGESYGAAESETDSEVEEETEVSTETETVTEEAETVTEEAETEDAAEAEEPVSEETETEAVSEDAEPVSEELATEETSEDAEPVSEAVETAEVPEVTEAAELESEEAAETEEVTEAVEEETAPADVLEDMDTVEEEPETAAVSEDAEPVLEELDLGDELEPAIEEEEQAEIFGEAVDEEEDFAEAEGLENFEDIEELEDIDDLEALESFEELEDFGDLLGLEGDAWTDADLNADEWIAEEDLFLFGEDDDESWDLSEEQDGETLYIPFDDLTGLEEDEVIIEEE